MSSVTRLVEGAQVEPVVMVHISTSDIGKCRWLVLQEEMRLLGRMLKSRTPKVASSEMLPVPYICMISQTSGAEECQCVDEMLLLGRAPNLLLGSGIHWGTYHTCHLNHSGIGLLLLTDGGKPT